MAMAILNTKIYLGHPCPYNVSGLETYQLAGWPLKAKATKLQFAQADGDASETRIEIWDRPHDSRDAQLLHTIVVQKTALVPLEWVFESSKERLFLRLLAVDGVSLNNAQVVVYGDPV